MATTAGATPMKGKMAAVVRWWRDGGKIAYEVTVEGALLTDGYLRDDWVSHLLDDATHREVTASIHPGKFHKKPDECVHRALMPRSSPYNALYFVDAPAEARYRCDECGTFFASDPAPAPAEMCPGLEPKDRVAFGPPRHCPGCREVRALTAEIGERNARGKTQHEALLSWKARAEAAEALLAEAADLLPTNDLADEERYELSERIRAALARKEGP